MFRLPLKKKNKQKEKLNCADANCSTTATTTMRSLDQTMALNISGFGEELSDMNYSSVRYIRFSVDLFRPLELHQLRISNDFFSFYCCRIFWRLAIGFSHTCIQWIIGKPIPAMYYVKWFFYLGPLQWLSTVRSSSNISNIRKCLFEVFLLSCLSQQHSKKVDDGHGFFSLLWHMDFLSSS